MIFLLFVHFPDKILLFVLQFQHSYGNKNIMIWTGLLFNFFWIFIFNFLFYFLNLFYINSGCNYLKWHLNFWLVELSTSCSSDGEPSFAEYNISSQVTFWVLVKFCASIVTKYSPGFFMYSHDFAFGIHFILFFL